MEQDNIVKNENYIVIQGFMVTDLKLKGNELLTYAIIYGFSQAQNQSFNGSLSYLAEWTNSTKQGVLKNLKSLLEKGLIIKSEKFLNGVKFVEYAVTKFNGIKQSLMGGIKQSLTNNIENNKLEEKNIIKKETAKFVPPTLEEVKEYAKSRGREDLAQKFLEYYTAGNWVDGKGNKVRNWKQKFLTWTGRDNMGLKLEQSFGGNDESVLHNRKYSKEDLDDLIVDLDKIEI